MQTNYTQTLANFACDTTFEDFPSATIHAAKRLILDTLGNTVGGSTTEAAKLAIKTCRELGGNHQSTIICTDIKTSCTHAVFANVIQASALEADDTCLNLGHHAQNSLMPALALTEQRQASGKALLEAFILAYDIGARIASAARHMALDEHGNIKVNPSNGGVNWVVFPAVIGAGKIIGLKPNEMISAMGIAGFTATVPTGARWVMPPRNHLKYNPYAFMAQSSTLGALLAENGFTGDPAILDGDDDLGLADWWLMSGTVGSEPTVVTTQLGKRWFVNDASIKPYPSCRFTHPALELFSNIFKENKLNAEDIDGVVIKTITQMFVYRMDNPLVASAMDCEFSMPHCIAMVALGIPPGPEWVDSRYWNHPQVETLKAKVRCEPFPEADEAAMEQLLKGTWTRLPTQVEVLAKGQTYRAETDRAPGDPIPGKMMSDEEVIAKFRVNCAPVLSENTMDRCIETLMSLEQLTSIDPLLDGFRPPPESAAAAP